jgi:hypothetical protein
MRGLFDSLYIILTGADRLFMIQATIVEEMVSDTDFTKPPLAEVIVDHTKVSAEPMRDWLWSLGDDYVSRESSRTNTGSECSSSSMRRHSLKSSSDINEDIVSEKLVNVLLDDESLLASKP